MGTWIRRAVLLSTMLTVAGVACSSRDDGFGDGGTGLLPDAGQEDSASSCGGKRCSRDLHAVVDDCTEEVVETCADNLGCANGNCVSACESAAASQGSIGCSFFAIAPDGSPLSDASCYAAFIANTWSTPVNVTAEFDGQPLDISKSIYRAVLQGQNVTYERIEGAIPPRELGIVFLAQGEGRQGNSSQLNCPDGVEVARREAVVTGHRTSIYPAFHLMTDAPVSAYSIFPYGGADSHEPAATLLLPTSSWDTSYLLFDGWSTNTNADISRLTPFIQIVAQEDNTEVRVRPQVDILDGDGVRGGARGTVTKWTLNRGQVLEITQRQSLSGSPLEASHPVALFGGNQCAYVPDNAGPCDALQQQIPPVRQWASSYSAVPYESRRTAVGTAAPESVVWRIVGAADGTALTYDPAPPLGAPPTLASGQVVTFESEFPFKVKSQDTSHPFYLAVFMSGAARYNTLGDPDFVNIVADDQFLDHYVFFLDYTYSNSNLTVVRRKDMNGFHDVTLDCLGPVTGWQLLGSDGTTEYAWVDITRGRAPVGECNYGRHEAQSDGAFGLYAWGLDDYASYGFPAGAGSRPTSPYTIAVH